MAETEKWLHYWDRLFINEMIFEITRWVLKRKAKSESTELNKQSNNERDSDLTTYNDQLSNCMYGSNNYLVKYSLRLDYILR